MSKKNKNYSGTVKGIINSALKSLVLTLLIMGFSRICYMDKMFFDSIINYVYIFVGNFLLFEILRKNWLKKKTKIVVLVLIFVIIFVSKSFINNVPYETNNICKNYTLTKEINNIIDVISEDCITLKTGFIESICILYSFIGFIALFILNLIKKIFRKTTKNAFNQILKQEEKDKEK